MANYFYKTNSGDYSPAELAVAKFNFEDGIYKSYHTFINPGIQYPCSTIKHKAKLIYNFHISGEVAIGYAYEAKLRSEKVHRLPPPTNAMGEKNYETIYKAMLDVIEVRPDQRFDKSDDRRPCVFIRKEDTEMIESVLDQLSDQQWKETFDVFELELLFNRLKNKANDDFEPIRISVTNSFIEQDRYDATPNISCDFHENEDATRHCALSYVRRWFFLFCDHVCEKIGIKLIPGKHLPSDALIGAPQQFDAFGQDAGKSRRDDHCSFVSSAYSGYSKFNDMDDSSSEDY